MVLNRLPSPLGTSRLDEPRWSNNADVSGAPWVRKDGLSMATLRQELEAFQLVSVVKAPLQGKSLPTD